jgi:hypothetical protein
VNVKTNTRSTVQKSVDYDAFIRVLKSNPKASIEDIRPDGDVIFSVPLSKLGLNAGILSDNMLTGTDFFCNFVGEFIVRKNVNEFAEVLFSVDPKSYEEIVCSEEHTGFGTIVSKNSIMRFSMHISLVQRILIEDFKKILE